VGACPTEWKQPYIDELTDLLTNGFVGTSLPHQTENSETGIRYLQGFNVRPNKLDLTRTTWVTHDFHAKNRKSQLREGDVLVVQSGHIGTAAVVSKEAAGSNCHAVIICRFNPEIVDPDFASQYLNSSIGQARLRGLHVGSSLPHINTSELGRFKLPLPPLHEQRKLAELWVTWDTAIQKTEQLIAAKERSSKALMQRVFGPSTYPRLRLSEFTRRITRKNIEGNGHPLTISGAEGLVSQSRYFGKRIAAEQTEHYTLLKRGEFAYNKSYSAGYPLGAIKRLDGHAEGIVSTLYLCFALDESKAPPSDYFAYFCEAGGYNHQIYQVAQEGARNHGLLNVTAEDFFSMKMPVPPREVQERVVRALGAAHHELALLRDQLTALREQKRGLMQKLLTGQWRLPVHEEAATA
jgi:type I restriction enzyme S subunit